MSTIFNRREFPTASRVLRQENDGRTLHVRCRPLQWPLDNVIENNGTHGISIGHNDTDNLCIGNQSRRNGATGVTFRRDGPLPDRGVFRANTIEDNGKPEQPGVGSDLNHPARGTVLEKHLVRDTRPEGQRTQATALRLHPDGEQTRVADDNRFEGQVQKPDPSSRAGRE